jgi:hypothetical protein
LWRISLFAMLIQNAVKSIDSYTRRWVRVEHVRDVPVGLEVCFTIHNGKDGKRLHCWSVTCCGVQEASITDFNGGGLAVYSSSHPAARQYTAPQAELRWPRTCDEGKVLSALCKAHFNVVNEWIPLGRYLFTDPRPTEHRTLPCFQLASGSSFACLGPDFLLRVYAKALESVGARARLTVRGKGKSIRPKVLHFGNSYVVANSFTARRQD